jgi:hypothetical protein
MKLKLTILLLAVSYFVSAQKQIQPYTFSKTDDKGKVKTIIIYASAKTANSIKFTLKNDKDEVLKKESNKEDDITFEVSPFTEIVFRSKLKEAIIEIQPDAEANKIIDFEKSKEDNKSVGRESYVREIRNIYQFFNALIITAFQYDTEPVAGSIKYSLNTIITKKNIEGLNADFYFKKNAKFIRSVIRENGNQILNRDSLKFKKKYNFLKENDNFIKYIISNKEIMAGFNNYYQNLRRSNKHNASVKFKNYSKEHLKELYNLWKLEELLLSQKQKKEISFLEDSLNIIRKNIINSKKNFKDYSFERQITEGLKQISYNKIIDSINSKIKSVILNKKYDDTFFENYVKIKTQILISEDSISISEKNQIKYKIKLDLITNTISNKNKLIKEQDSIIEKKNFELLDIYKTVENKISAKAEKNIDKVKNDIEQIEEKRELYEAESNILWKEKELYIDSLKNNIKFVKFKKQENILFQNNLNFFIARNRNKIKSLPVYKFNITDLELDINDGFIEHISVVGKVTLPHISETLMWNYFDGYIQSNQKLTNNYNIKIIEILENFYKEPLVKDILGNILGKELKFVNEFPLGFSSKTDFDDLYSYNLYHSEGTEKVFSMPVTNVITAYIQKHQNDRLNFSPKNQVVTLPTDDIDRDNILELKKEISSKILNAKIYSDFVGFQEDEPNGLVQIEIEKKIPIWTKRFILGAGRSTNLGLFNYANFNLTWARIEDDKKDLQVRYSDRFVNNIYTPEKFVTYLDLIRYENASVGVDLNIASVDMPTLKGRFEFNLGIHYGRVQVVDTLGQVKPNQSPNNTFEKNINIIRWYPDFIYRIRPEERFGGYLRFRPFRVIVPTNSEFKSTSLQEDFVTDSSVNENWLYRFELSTFYTPSADSDNRFFFRYRYTNSTNWDTNGFGEFQVGYLAYLKF